MKKPTSKRPPVHLTPEQMEQLCKDRELIAGELPTLAAKQKRLRAAAEESSTSGALRRAIHSSQILLHDLANQAGTDTQTLDKFLLGAQPLTSDVIDRLTQLLNLTLARVNGRGIHETQQHQDVSGPQRRPLKKRGKKVKQ